MIKSASFMQKLRQLTRAFISRLPRSEVLAACCRHYYAHYMGGEATNDIHTNGELRLLREIAPQLVTVLDIGANVGDWTKLLLSLKPTVRIHAFEPAVRTFEQLQRCQFPANVTIHKIALSSTQGTARFNIFGDASGLNSLHNRHGLEDGEGIAPASRYEEVQLDTVDAFCARNALTDIDFIKVDVEGHEVDVLAGSKSSIAAGVPKRIQIEYGGTYIDSRRLLKDVFDLFSGSEYVLFLIVPNGLVAYPRYDQRLENFAYKNFIAIHRTAIAHTPSARRALMSTQIAIP